MLRSLPAILIATLIAASMPALSQNIKTQSTISEVSTEQPKVLAPAVAPGDRLPDLSAIQINGELMKVDWTAARYTIVHVWTAWATQAHDQVGLLGELHALHAGDGLQTIGLLRQPLKAGHHEQIVERFEVDYPLLVAHPEHDAPWRIYTAFPTTFIVDPEGRLVRRYLGYSDLIGEGMRRDVDALMAGERMGSLDLPQRSDYITEEQFARERARRGRRPPSPR